MSTRSLQNILQQSSLHTLLMVTSKMLSQSGFGDVQILDRRETRQKSRFGGHELLCQTTMGSLPIRVIVKVINDAVRLRMMDELAGAVMRTKADMGLIVSPHHVTASAKRHQAAHKTARVTVIDGSELANRLIRLGIGVRSFGEVDYQYFGHLEEYGERVLEFIKSDFV